MRWRHATGDDVVRLAPLNRELQEDEGSTVMETRAIEARMRRWLATGYGAVVFENGNGIVAYAVYRDTDPDSQGVGGIYLRQFYVVREARRAGLGRRAFEILVSEVWPAGRRVVLEAMSTNPGANHFWRALGFREYSITYERHSP